MATITLNEVQVKRHIELLETIAQMLTKEAEILRAETKVGEAKISKRKTKLQKEIEFEIQMRRTLINRYRVIMRKLATPEDQERLREIARERNRTIRSS